MKATGYDYRRAHPDTGRVPQCTQGGKPDRRLSRVFSAPVSVPLDNHYRVVELCAGVLTRRHPD